MAAFAMATLHNRTYWYVCNLLAVSGVNPPEQRAIQAGILKGAKND